MLVCMSKVHTHTRAQTDTHKQKTLEQVAKDKNSPLFKVKIQTPIFGKIKIFSVKTPLLSHFLRNYWTKLAQIRTFVRRIVGVGIEGYFVASGKN